MARAASSPAPPLTQLLVAWGRRDEGALNRLTPLVYKELRRLAQWHMNRERREHTLQATAVVNEAYLRVGRHQPDPMAGPRAFLRDGRAADASGVDRRRAQARQSETRRRRAESVARRRSRRSRPGRGAGCARRSADRAGADR